MNDFVRSSLTLGGGCCHPHSERKQLIEGVTSPVSWHQEVVARIPLGWSDSRVGVGEAEQQEGIVGAPHLCPERLTHTLCSENTGLKTASCNPRGPWDV